eukprot:11633973-Alexandrium_andersonii.AAC.1
MSCAVSGTFTWQGAHSAIRNGPHARQCCHPPQSIIRPAEHVKLHPASGGPRENITIGTQSSRE